MQIDGLDLFSGLDGTCARALQKELGAAPVRSFRPWLPPAPSGRLLTAYQHSIPPRGIMRHALWREFELNMAKDSNDYFRDPNLRACHSSALSIVAASSKLTTPRTPESFQLSYCYTSTRVFACRKGPHAQRFNVLAR